MIKSRARTRLVFVQIGVLAWGVLAIVAIALLVSQAQGLFNVWQLPLAPLGAGLAGIGCVAFISAGLLTKRSRIYMIFFAVVLLALLNGLAYFGAYTLTHFNDSFLPGLAFAPKPENARNPAEFDLSYVTERITINDQEWLETWRVATYGESKGSVILFPGNGGNKAHQLMIPAQVFNELGYTTLMVDFRGQGGSSGNSTTLGLRESEDVAYALRQAANLDLPTPHVLYGVSLGSAAIMRAVDAGLEPDAIILESPFAYMMNAVKTRMRAQDFPTLGIAELLVFWGSIQHGYNGFGHNPMHYAKSVEIPAMVLHGKRDRWTTTTEIEQLYQNLQGPKALALFPNAGHDLLVTVDRTFWTNQISEFLSERSRS